MAPSELLAEGRRIIVMRLSDFGMRSYSLNLIVNDAAGPRRKSARSRKRSSRRCRRATAW
jgi:hypothetical protein